MTFEGYAAVFNSPSEPLPFIERIAPGAFKRTLRERSDVKLLWNHDSNHPLASTRGGSLKLTEDNYGLRVEARLANTQAGRDAAELIRTNVVDAMSFGFTVPEGGAEWNENGTERTLKSVRLFEVSVVPWPAYPSTGGTVSVRGLAALARRAAVDVDALADALMKLENGEAITQDERQLIDQVLDEVAPKAEEKVEDDKGLAMLELKKKKLQLLLDL
jgi:HK97 family phage prohead protease